MLTRRHLAAALVGAITATLAPVPATAAPSVALKVTQSGTSATVTWRYKGATPASQKLTVTRVPLDGFESTDPLIDTPQEYSPKRSARSQKVSDLVPGAKYTITISSKKPSLTKSRSFLMLAKPTRPADISLSWDDDTLVARWLYDGPAVSSWTITSAGSDGKDPVTTKANGSSNTARLKGLDKALGYTVTVRGTNAAGSGPVGDQTILQVAPNAASNLQVRPLTADGTKVAVSWEYDGPAVTGFRLQVRAAGYARNLDSLSAAAGVRQLEIDRLTPGGTYVFALTARNAESTALSTTAPYTVVKALGAPTALTVTPRNNAAELRWTAPVNDNPDVKITGYRIEYSGDDGVSWLPAVSVANSVIINNLINGKTYRFRVGTTIESSSEGKKVGGALFGDAVSVVVGQPPTAPTALTATAGTRQIELRWNAPQQPAGATFTYRVEYKTASETSWTTQPDITATTTTITGLNGGVAYNVRVAAIADSLVGAFSAPVTATPKLAPAAPSAPVLADITLTAGKPNLTWSAPANNGSDITTYVVERRDGEGIWNRIAPAQNATLKDTRFSEATAITRGVTTSYRVAAVNAVGTGAWSVEKSVTFSEAPDAPTITVSTHPTLGGTLLVEWAVPNDKGSPITGYRIEQRVGSGNWSTPIELTTTTYTASSLTNGISYSYRVSARNAKGWSTPSTAFAAVPSTVPGAVTGLKTEISVLEVKLIWTELPVNANGGSAVTNYNVSMRTVGGQWRQAPGGEVVTGTNFTVTDLLATAYEFRVAAVNAKGLGAYSAVVSATPLSAPPVLAEVSAVGGDAVVALSWSVPVNPNPSIPVTYRYKVEYSLDGSTWTLWKENLTATSENVTGLRNGTTYRFRVAAGYNTGSRVVYGAPTQAVGTPRGKPGAPEALSAVQLDVDTVRLTWSPPSNTGGVAVSEVDYEIQYTKDGTNWEPGTPINSQNTTADVDFPLAGVPYTFRVKSSTTYGQSLLYATVELAMVRLPVTIANLSVRQVANSSVTLGWSGNPAADQVTAYRIEYSAGDNVWSLFNDNLPSTNTVVQVTGLTNGTEYSFRVSAKNAAGFGIGAVVNATPAGPLPVTDLRATAGDTKVTLNWTLPVGGGATISAVRVRYSTDGVTWITHANLPANSVTTVVSSLANSTEYRFEVTVNTNLGDSAKAEVRATPWAQLPSVVQAFTATATGTSVALQWNTPATTGVGALTYKVEYKKSTDSDWTVATSSIIQSVLEYTISALTAATAYDFRVTATNAVGAGPSATATATTGA